MWLSPRDTPDPPASFKRKVLDYAHAGVAFEELTSGGVNGDMLWRHLWGLAALTKKTKSQRTRWYALPGVPQYQLRRFPSMVRGWAAQIERLDGKVRSNQPYAAISQTLPLLLADATENMPLSPSLALGLLQKQDQLPKLAEVPELLRLYADYIEALSKITAYYGSRVDKSFAGVMRQQLVRLVEAVTGMRHVDEVATLLTASNYAIGCDLEISPKALARQRSRVHSKK